MKRRFFLFVLIYFLFCFFIIYLFIYFLLFFVLFCYFLILFCFLFLFVCLFVCLFICFRCNTTKSLFMCVLFKKAKSCLEIILKPMLTIYLSIPLQIPIPISNANSNLYYLSTSSFCHKTSGHFIASNNTLLPPSNCVCLYHLTMLHPIFWVSLSCSSLSFFIFIIFIAVAFSKCVSGTSDFIQPCFWKGKMASKWIWGD